MHIIIQLKHLLLKRRIICQNSYRIVIYSNSFLYRLHCYRFLTIGNQPMELRYRQIFIESNTNKINFFQKCLCFLYCGTLTQNPRYEFKLRHIVLPRYILFIVCISHKIEARHTKALFIDRIIIKRIIIRNICHTNHCIMTFYLVHIAKRKRIITRRYDNLIAI